MSTLRTKFNKYGNLPKELFFLAAEQARIVTEAAANAEKLRLDYVGTVEDNESPKVQEAYLISYENRFKEAMEARKVLRAMCFGDHERVHYIMNHCYPWQIDGRE